MAPDPADIILLRDIFHCSQVAQTMISYEEANGGTGESDMEEVL